MEYSKNESETNLKCRKSLFFLVSQKRRSFFKTKTYFKQQKTLFSLNDSSDFKNREQFQSDNFYFSSLFSVHNKHVNNALSSKRRRQKINCTVLHKKPQNVFFCIFGNLPKARKFDIYSFIFGKRKCKLVTVVVTESLAFLMEQRCFVKTWQLKNYFYS